MTVLRALIICPDRQMSSELEAALTPHRNWVVSRLLDEYPDMEAIDYLMRHFAPSIVFISMQSPAKAEQLAAAVQSISRGTILVALHSDYDVYLLRLTIRAGMREFFVRPFEPAEVTSALSRFVECLEAHPPAIRFSRNVLGFLSAKPGCGASTIAMHTALELANQTNLRTLLLDMDYRASMLAFSLKIPNAYGISDVSDHHAALDESIWCRVVTKIGRIDCVSMGSVACDSRLSTQRLLSFYSYAQRNYDIVCVDLPSGLDADLPELMEQCTGLFLVSTPEVGPMFLAGRTLEMLERLGLRDRTKLIMNRVRKESALVDVAEQVLGKPVYAQLPNCYSDLQQAVREGRTLNRNSQFGKGIQKMVGRFMGKPEETGQHRESLLTTLKNMLTGRPPKMLLAPVAKPVETAGLLPSPSPSRSLIVAGERGSSWR